MDQKIIQVGSSIAVVLPAQDAREEGFVVGESITVKRESGRFVIEKKAPQTKSPVIAETVKRATAYIEKYRKDFEALADK